MISAIASSTASTIDPPAVQTPEQEVMAHFDKVLADLLAGCAAAEPQVGAAGDELQTLSNQQPPDNSASEPLNADTPPLTKTDLSILNDLVDGPALETEKTGTSPFKSDDSAIKFLNALDASKVYRTNTQISLVADALFKTEA